jgi:hypothetical protein
MGRSTIQQWLIKPRPTPALWVGLGFCAALGLAVGALILVGAGTKGVHGALLATARLAFLFFWPAYAGSALVSLFRSTFQPLKRFAREYGLAFASVLIVHLTLVAWLCLIGAAPPLATFVIFGIAAAFAYMLAFFSIPRLQHALGPRYWKVLRIIGLNYIAFAFALDFLRQPLRGGVLHVVEYAPFAALAVAGPCLRLAEFAQRRFVGQRPS